MLIPFTEIEHPKNLLKKTPYLQEKSRESRNEIENRNNADPKFSSLQRNWEKYNNLLSKEKVG